MKKKNFLVLLFGLMTISSLALAQIVGIERIQGDHWFTGDRKVSFGDTPNSQISYTGGNLVLDIISGTGQVSLPDGIVTSKTNAAGGSANPLDITSALGIMNGSDDYTAIDVNITNADHTGSNESTIQGLDISGITGDAQATETAINIGNGWDVGINAGNNSINTTGQLASGAIVSTSSITSTATGSIGWSIVTGANVACTTTCTSACVVGWNTAAGEVAVDCADATADKCLCAGTN